MRRLFSILILLLLTSGAAFAPTRPILTADTIYYVSTQGNDSNDCSATDPNHACLTIPHVIGIVENLDLSTFNVTIQVSDGTYTVPIGIGIPFLSSGGFVTLQGNVENPGNCIIHTTSVDAITVGNAVTMTIQGFKLSTTTSGSGLFVLNNASVTIRAMEFGSCATYHMNVQVGGAIYVDPSYKVSGNALVHIFSAFQARVIYNGPPAVIVTLSGTPVFTYQFVYCTHQSIVLIYPVTFLGSASAMARYYVDANSVIDTGGGGPNFLPGNAAGAAAHGGQYF